jgi:hypothetical protein
LIIFQTVQSLLTMQIVQGMLQIVPPWWYFNWNFKRNSCNIFVTTGSDIFLEVVSSFKFDFQAVGIVG